ncbi:nicotinamide mononucleotide deamidase-related protein [Stetteria hydrogenophila]
MPADRLAAWIISVGNELLIGRVVNTNASYLARRLTFLGFNVDRIITVPDKVEDIVEELRRGLGRARLIITTGGLGPTMDDLTLEGIARAVNRPLQVNEEAYRQVKEFYERRGLPMTRERVKMAMLPEGAIPLRNPVGAAPGVFLEVDGRVIVALPGVPREMEAIFEGEVVPRIKRLAPKLAVVECGVVVRGVPESSLAPLLGELARRNPSAYIKSHPKGHEVEEPVVDVRVLASAEREEDALELARNIIGEVKRKARELGGALEEEHCKGAS